MRIRTFIALVLLAAALICVVAFLGRSRGAVPTAVGASWRGERPDFVFVPRPNPDGRISCAVTSDDDWTTTWSGQPQLCTLGRGWTQTQSWGIWATGIDSRVTFRLETVTPRTLVMDLRSNSDLPDDSRQAVRIIVNGHRVDRQEVPSYWRQIHVDLPAEVLERGANEIIFEFEASISPLDAGKNSDHRAFAARVRELALLANREGGGSDRQRGPQPVRIWDPDRGVFALQRSGTLVMPFTVPDNVGGLRIKVGASRSVDVQSASVTATVEDLDGSGRRQVPVNLRKWPGSASVVLDVSHLAGREVLVSVAVELDSGQLDIAPATVVAKQADKPPSTAPAEPVSDGLDTGGRRPDVVVIILDAARADRFSFAGNDRETTPAIDELAAESLVFPHAYALAPYTLCSVPTIITGLSFLDHGVVEHEDVLSEDAVTLAESLKPLGYRTACFSATPNNSRAKGFDQGYDIFREMWTEGPRNETRRAFFIARQVVEWLSGDGDVHNDDRPLHLLVHMVPPHAPYDPPDVFNLFTDPEYAGPCAGYERTLNALDGGSLKPDQACLDHVLGLYDGNLRTADNATRVILTALRRHRPWRDTVVLVISDHGEAFYEHGRMEHNSTLYSEMMHVPFVLRLPPGAEKTGIDTGRLVTLADIVPTLVAAAGGDPPTITEGVNLLDRALTLDGRSLVTRTADRSPTIGIRTLHWSMMVNPGGSGALYDLATDPGELDNVAVDHPGRFAGLGKILKTRIQQPPRLTASDETADITEEERALLETLGYLR
jgi:arylsulfatase A-like enzyme